ncbi:MAG: glycosyltransferase [Rubricoccaceae bacterium]|nr:glycosyltransferase [Rubricoccaceae bacterium]
MDQVTFVIATYQRADVLRCTLESLRLQKHESWDAIVVGDCCDEKTESMLRSIGDPRIAYYNLPQRFGEQSGPNSVGLALAEGNLVTFLNHDDLLLPDHISYGLDCIAETGADFFIGKAANTTKIENARPVFTDTLPRSTDLRRLLLPPLYAFDPSSFWLIKTEYARKVGHWRSARTLFRTPLGDWLLRAWNLGGSFVFGERITGMRFRTHYLRTDRPLYENHSPEHETILERLRSEFLEDIRADVVRQIEAHGGAEQPEKHLLLRSIAAGFYGTVGFDVVPLLVRLRGGKGSILRRIAKQRTGADLPEPPDINELIANAESFRIL